MSHIDQQGAFPFLININELYRGRGGQRDFLRARSHWRGDEVSPLIEIEGRKDEG
jgi:hypothetical protein